MKKYKFLTLISILIIFAIIFNVIGNQNDVLATTTEQIEVVSKHNSLDEQWIILANDKKVFIENFSIWALIKENEIYTINYVLMKSPERYYLKKIVPHDYNGQF